MSKSEEEQKLITLADIFTLDAAKKSFCSYLNTPRYQYKYDVFWTPERENEEITVLIKHYHEQEINLIMIFKINYYAFIESNFNDHLNTWNKERLNWDYIQYIELNASEVDLIFNFIKGTKQLTRYISGSVKQKVWDRDHGKCVYCGSVNGIEYDHIIPFSKGGSNSEKNIQLVCSECNKKKGNKINDDYLKDNGGEQ